MIEGSGHNEYLQIINTKGIIPILFPKGTKEMICITNDKPTEATSWLIGD